MGTDDFHKKRKARNTAQKRVEKKAVLIALEDTKSSKYYFQSLIKEKGFIGKVIIAKHQGSDPKNVLKALQAYEQENPKVRFEKKWIVIDKDNFPKNDFKGTIETAREKNICVAFSNISYELWILMHFEEITAFIDNSTLKPKLNQHFQALVGKDYEKSQQDIYQLISDKQSLAITRAQNLVTKHQRDHGELNPYEQNPLTMIHQLVLCLNSFNQADKNCNCYPLS